jgi:CHASE2 domain-containing sensor protein
MKDVIEPHANLAPLFKDRVVFVGQRSPARHLEEPVDQHKTPYTGQSDQLSTGVELQATIYCNLVEDEWLKESKPIAGSAMALMGLVAGAWFIHSMAHEVGARVRRIVGSVNGRVCSVPLHPLANYHPVGCHCWATVGGCDRERVEL